MYKQNNKIFLDFKIPQFQSLLQITEHVREVKLGEYQEKKFGTFALMKLETPN